MQSPAAIFTNRASALSLAHVSLVFAGMMWVYSFLNSYHAYPVTTFYQEWGTAVLGLAAMVLLLGGDYWRQAEIPRIVFLPLGMMLLVVVQFLLGKVAYFGQMLLFTLYLMWATLLVMVGARLREALGLPAVVTALAVFLLLGAELNALAGLHQHYQWHSFLDQWVTGKVSAAVFGNVAQQNHYANYLVLGLASLGLLYARGAVRAWQTVLLALPILYVLPLTGTRATWIYLWLLAAGSTWMWLLRGRAQRPLFYYGLLVLLGFGLMHLVIQLPWLQGPSGSVNTLQRMLAEDVSSGHIRLYLGHEAGMMFLNSPLLGVGFGQYGWHHYELGPVLHDPGISGLYNNAHNLIMHLAAEGGLAALLVLAATLLPWLRRAWREEHSIYHWWGYTLLVVLAAHSMLEYPLWYAYFLGIAALTLGMFDTGRYRLEFGFAGRMLVLLTLLLGAVSLQQLFTGYRHYENLLRVRLDAENPAAYIESVNRSITEMQKRALLQPYADLQISSGMEVSADRLEDKLKLNSDVMHFVPMPGAAYRRPLLLALNGDMAEAQAEMERAIWAYPGNFPAEVDRLGQLAAKDPDHFRALLEFTLRKHEEYLSAVHTK